MEDTDRVTDLITPLSYLRIIRFNFSIPKDESESTIN